MSAGLVEARVALKSVFGYDDSRHGQEEIVGWTLAGENVFTVLRRRFPRRERGSCAGLSGGACLTRGGAGA